MKIGIVGYYWLDTWILANVIQLATQDFCKRFLYLQNDPCGRQYDQMTQAARSCTANIAEGNSRHYTSRETEMKLTDVARASLSELATIISIGCCKKTSCHGRLIRRNTLMLRHSRWTRRIIKTMSNTRVQSISLHKSTNSIPG